MNIIEKIFNSEVGNLETRKTLNRSTKQINSEIIEEIEHKGVTLEHIESLDIPVYKYQTQITLHGVFNELNKNILFGYKNLFLNGNKTLGVRYTAIDAEKKYKIRKSLVIANRILSENKLENTINFSYKRDSSGDELVSYISFNKENIDEKRQQAKQIYNSIPDLFIGGKSLYVLSGLGRYYFVVEIGLNGIYEKNLWDFISYLTNNLVNETLYNDIIEKERKKSEEDELKREQDRIKKENDYNDWRNNQQINQKWKTTKPTKFTEGDVIIKISNSNKIIWCYFVVKNPENNRTSYFYKSYKSVEEINFNETHENKTLKNIIKLYHENLEYSYFTTNKQSIKKEPKIKTIKVEEKKIEQIKNSEVEIKHNEDKNGIEIYFALKPKQSILNILKEKGFKWIPDKNSYNGKNYWYKRYTLELMREVKLLLNK